jgi:hypothetical protein
MDIFALFHPSAADAANEWRTRNELPAPVPSPGEGPGRILDGGRIVIEVPPAR